MEPEDEGCSTPRRHENQIAVMSVPPAAPKKKRYDYGGERPHPPKSGFFQPPDLELLFVVPPRRRQACA
ncbi:unnamed protein product [Coffea canephora]|uniref:Uncharacterized protein n=1 Tax=Coffea canephora TaxID=49390 RepID=A0A068UKM0_COFCA|nr:unnamed protein product [Coffea canephora]